MKKSALCKVRTGPIGVQEYADRAREAGYNVTVVGTEHLHVVLEDSGDGWGILESSERLGVALKAPHVGVVWLRDAAEDEPAGRVS